MHFAWDTHRWVYSVPTMHFKIQVSTVLFMLFIINFFCHRPKFLTLTNQMNFRSNNWRGGFSESGTSQPLQIQRKVGKVNRKSK